MWNIRVLESATDDNLSSTSSKKDNTGNKTKLFSDYSTIGKR